MSADTTTYGSVIMSLLKENFGLFTLWTKLEPELAVYCSRIPQTDTVRGKAKVVEVLKDIKTYLLGKDIPADTLIFLDEEIERYEKTVQIMKYTDKEDALSEEVIKKYAALTSDEGVIGIHLALNYEQLKKLTNGVYDKTGLIKFYISPEITIAGKIVAEIFEYPQDIPVATLVQSTLKDNKKIGPITKIMMFGEKINKVEWLKLKEVKIPFYVYRFIAEGNQEFVLLSVEPQTIGDYIIQGVTTEVDDYKAVSESSKLPTKLPYLFAQTTRNRIIKFRNHAELFDKLNQLKISKNTLYDYIFTVRKDNKNIILKHPEWFKWLIWSWLTHANYGLTTEYPMHLMIIGDPGGGKSTLLNALHLRTKEVNPLFSGVSSTLKDLVPSFKYKPAKLGYLAESNRFAFLDELLRCIIRMKAGKEAIDEELAIMNDLLEHQKRRAGSGVSQVNVNMTSRIIATTNPVREAHTITDLINKFDKSWCSRWLMYFQTREHVKSVQEVDESQLKISEYTIEDNDFVSILDYLQTFPARFDEVEVMKLFHEILPLLNDDLKDHYMARHKHHIRCLMDGIVKARCIFEHDISFSAQSEDYATLRSVWVEIIKSWIDISNINHVPVEHRISYLPEASQYVYRTLCKQGIPYPKGEFFNLLKAELTQPQYVSAIMMLIHNGVVIETDTTLRPWWMKENGEKNE